MNDELLKALGEGLDLKQVLKITSHDEQQRARLGALREAWVLISKLLDDHNLDPLVYKIITNLAACDSAGALADRAQVISKLISHASEDASPALWRALSNLSQTSSRDLAGEKLAYGPALSQSPEPALRLIETNVRHFPLSSAEYTQNGVLSLVLSRANEWHDSSSTAVLIAAQIFILIIDTNVTCIPALITLSNSETAASLFRLIDAAVDMHKSISASSAHDLALILMDPLREIINDLVPVFQAPEMRREKINEWISLISLMETMVMIAPAALDELGGVESGLIPSLATLLIAADGLPKRGKLNNVNEDMDNFEDFPHIKTGAIPLISLLVVQNTPAQDYMRTSGGLAALLNSCTVDENNPFVRERAILGVRYLLDNNTANQQFVASLEAKKSIDSEALARAGYEAEFTNGKISVKPVD